LEAGLVRSKVEAVVLVKLGEIEVVEEGGGWILNWSKGESGMADLGISNRGEKPNGRRGLSQRKLVETNPLRHDHSIAKRRLGGRGIQSGIDGFSHSRGEIVAEAVCNKVWKIFWNLRSAGRTKPVQHNSLCATNKIQSERADAGLNTRFSPHVNSCRIILTTPAIG
jgi:hypothetical protein